VSDPTNPDELGFDALDATIGERLRAAAPAAPDTDAALAGLRPTFARARRRHQVVVAGAVALGVVLVMSVGALALRSGGAGNVKTPPATRPDTTTTAPTTLPSSAATIPDSGPGATTPTSLDDHGDRSGSGSGTSGSGSGSSGSGSGSSGSGTSGSGSGSSGSGGSD